jgi:cyclic pyranopterin phosphate synthase
VLGSASADVDRGLRRQSRAEGEQRTTFGWVTTSSPLPDPRLRPQVAAGTAGSGGLVDRHGRVATDLRVSLTDRCNLRCTYCMPPEGLQWLPKVEQLTDDEVVRLVRIGVELLGIHEVRFTGGEPLLRPGLPGIVAATTALTPRPEVSLTTNAIGLSRMAPALAAAGLDRINVSLDTLDRERFKQLTGCRPRRTPGSPRSR